MPNHIQCTTDLGKGWCGEILGNEFYFDDAEKAALAAKYKNEHTACDFCVKEIFKYLNNERVA